MDNNRVVIVGAGIGGLAAGIYAQLNGYESEIFEMHNLPGGQCTSWKRDNYTFDGCIHHLAGCKPDTLLYAMWKELGVFPTCQTIFPQDMCQVEDQTGKRFTVYVNLERLKQEMTQLAPQDTTTIAGYIKAAQNFTTLDMLDMPLLGTGGFAKRFLKMAAIMKYNVSMSKYAEKFQDSYMRKAFSTIQYDWTETPLLIHLNMIGNCHSNNYGVLKGGSLELSRAMEQRYKKLGGTLHYNAKVTQILTENNHAVGVKLMDNSEHHAGFVASDAFAHSTIYSLLKGRYIAAAVEKQFDKPKDEVEMGVHVSFGVSMDLSKEPRALVLFLEQPTLIAGKERTKLDLEIFGYDPTIAPQGKSVIKILLSASYTFWRQLHQDPIQYNTEKQKVAQTVLQLLKKRYPDIADHVEVTDVATPITTERFTGIDATYDLNWGFSGMLNFMRGKPKTLPGLKNLYLVGGQAGLPGCAAQARNTVREICHKSGKPFKTTAD
jgi:phytoene dehydrogenase-like protein